MRTSAMRATFTGILVVPACFFQISCSGGDAPREGTPAFYWAAALETFAAKDYVKTIQHLENTSATDNEFTARARPWLLVMTSGMARGYAELADSFDTGAMANKANPAPFRRQTNTYRGEANRLSLEFVEVLDKFQKGKDDPVPLAFPFPSGSAAPVAQLSKVGAGIMPAQAEIDSSEKRAIERGVLLTVCSAAGASDDPAKTSELLKPGTLQVPRAAFVTAMASTLFDESQLYGARKMDDPQKAKIFCNRALDALKTVPETKQTKDLGLKIAKSLKPASR